jgi:hypothetical protein
MAEILLVLNFRSCSLLMSILYCVHIGRVSDVSEAHAAYIFRIEASVVRQCLCREGWKVVPGEGRSAGVTETSATLIHMVRII